MFDINLAITFLSAIISVYIYVLIYNRISNLNKKLITVNYIEILISAFLIAFNNLYNIIYFRVIITMAITISLYKVIFKEDNNKTIFNGLIIFLTNLIIEVIGLLVINNIFKDILVFNDYVLFKFIYSILISYVLYFLLKQKVIIIWIDKTFKNLKTNFKFLIYIFSVIFFINIIYSIYSFDLNDYKYYILLCMFVFMAIIFVYSFFQKSYESGLLKVKNECLETNVTNYESSIEDYRTLRHNLMNDLLYVKSSNNKEDCIDELIKKYNKKVAWVNELSKIQKGLQGVLYAKISDAEAVDVKVYIKNDLKNNDYCKNKKLYLNICEVVGICMDNAIEAAKDCKDKLIYINMYKNDPQNIFIDITNTFCNEIDIDKLGKKNYSTKNRNSGIGLNYALNASPLIKVSSKIVEDLFITKIKVKIK